MSEQSDLVQEQLVSVEVAPALQEVLGNETSAPVNSPSNSIWAPPWSKLFQAFSDTCVILHEDPDIQLVDRPVEIPPQINWLGGQFLQLLNGSLLRDSDAAYQMAADGIRDISDAKGKYDVCKYAEYSFTHYLKYTAYPEQKMASADFYVDPDNNPVMVTKHVGSEWHGQTTLSFRDISINRLTYPAGTIFMVERAGGDTTDQSLYSDGFCNVLGLDVIAAIRPLRLSLFPVPELQRPDVIKKLPEKSWKAKVKNKDAVKDSRDIPSLQEMRLLAADHISFCMSRTGKPNALEAIV
jgi:hypothetical protein